MPLSTELVLYFSPDPAQASRTLAVLTPTNVSWSFCALCEEPGREHQALHRK